MPLASKEGTRGRETEGADGAFANYERENQMRRDDRANTVLALNKSALRVEREEGFGFFFFLVLICLRELENQELSGWMINGKKITFR